MKKIILKFMLAITLPFLALPILAQDVNSTDSGLIINGGLGYGATTFGIIPDSTDEGDLGTGPGGALFLGAMFNYSIISFGINYTRASFNDMEWKETISGTEHEFKSYGDGNFSTWTFLLGIKAFTEAGDMGYTNIYGGYRFWNAKRTIDYQTLDSIKVPNSDSEYELSGKGWIIGFKDLSTFPLGLFSLALQTGLWYANTPVNTLKANGVKADITKDQTAGFGFDIGAGLAFEDIGLSVIAGLTMDLTASTFKEAGNDNVAGAGYAEFYINVAKEFAF